MGKTEITAEDEAVGSGAKMGSGKLFFLTNMTKADSETTLCAALKTARERGYECRTYDDALQMFMHCREEEPLCIVIVCKDGQNGNNS